MATLDCHEKCRSAVCVVCYKKGKRTLTEKQIEFIQSNLIEGFTMENQYFPSSICVNCNIKLNGKISGKDIDLPMVESHELELPPLLRGTKCQCRICKVAKSSINSNLNVKKRGRPKIPETPVEHTASSSDDRKVICDKCYSQVGKGYVHKCTQRDKVSNVEKLLTPTTAQRYASRVISSTSTSNSKYPETPNVSLFGRPRKTDGGPTKKKKLFDVEDISRMQTDIGLTNRQTTRLGEHLRYASGSRKVIEGSMKEKIRQKNRRLEDLFAVKDGNFVNVQEASNTRENYERNFVVCNDLEALVQKIIEERSIREDDMLIRIGMDGGGGFMKICLSIFNLNEGDESEQIRMTARFKNSGVKRTIIIALVPDVQENYYNIKRLWLEAGIDKFSRRFTIATDLKLCNILLGLMSHSSSHPCSWCDIAKEKLHLKGVSRTIGSIMKLFWNYFEANAKRKDAKDYGNVVHPNMFADNNKIDENTLIILLVPPPELHLMLGPVNTMYDELVKVWPNAEEWSKRLHIKREQYHGGQFNGNDSRKLLKNLSVLKEIAPTPSLKVQNVIKAFDAFNDVVGACYGKNLQKGYESKIKLFQQAYQKLQINVTPKVHAVFYHIPEFCKIVKMGLSPWSEQATESLHHDFSKMWDNFKVRDLDNPKYGARVLEAVIMYNSQHL